MIFLTFDDFLFPFIALPVTTKINIFSILKKSIHQEAKTPYPLLPFHHSLLPSLQHCYLTAFLPPFLTALLPSFLAAFLPSLLAAFYFTSLPFTKSSGGETKPSFPSWFSAINIIPCDSMPLSFLGARFTRMLTFLPTISSGV